MCALESVYVCGFPPSFSQKEKSHIHSLTRPGRRSIATSWPPVWSKVNIWREATVQAGTWGLWVAQLCFSPSSHSPQLPTSPSLPLHLYSFFIHSGGPNSPKGLKIARVAAFGLGFVRCSVSWDSLSKESASLAWLVLPACCGLASLRALEDHIQRQASSDLLKMCIYMNTKQHQQGPSPSLCNLSGIWFSFRAPCSS